MRTRSGGTLSMVLMLSNQLITKLDSGLEMRIFVIGSLLKKTGCMEIIN